MLQKFIIVCCIVGLQLDSISAQAKMIFPGLVTPKVATVPGAVTFGSHLEYYGGPVIEQVRGFTVFWNDSVDSSTKSSMTKLYNDYVNSLHMDWLSEYQTGIKAIDGRVGTQQTIRRGSWIGEAVLKPSINSKQLDDKQIQREIELQIASGNLPIPDKNTLYMIHFPSDIQITIEGMHSCYSFGGYHYTFTSVQYGDIFYGVLPSCSFQSVSEVATHELVEAITDAKPTAGSQPQYPQAWNTTSGEEIADICAGSTTRFDFPTGTYTISKEWSNSHNKCFDGVR